MWLHQTPARPAVGVLKHGIIHISQSRPVKNMGDLNTVVLFSTGSDHWKPSILYHLMIFHTYALIHAVDGSLSMLQGHPAGYGLWPSCHSQNRVLSCEDNFCATMPDSIAPWWLQWSWIEWRGWGGQFWCCLWWCCCWWWWWSSSSWCCCCSWWWWWWWWLWWWWRPWCALYRAALDSRVWRSSGIPGIPFANQYARTIDVFAEVPNLWNHFSSNWL